LHNSSIYPQRNDSAFTCSEVILLTNSLTVTMPLCQFSGTKNSKYIHIFIIRYLKTYLKKKNVWILIGIFRWWAWNFCTLRSLLCRPWYQARIEALTMNSTVVISQYWWGLSYTINSELQTIMYNAGGKMCGKRRLKF